MGSGGVLLGALPPDADEAMDVKDAMGDDYGKGAPRKGVVNRKGDQENRDQKPIAARTSAGGSPWEAWKVVPPETRRVWLAKSTFLSYIVLGLLHGIASSRKIA